jgi:hypothetical protein
MPQGLNYPRSTRFHWPVGTFSVMLSIVEESANAAATATKMIAEAWTAGRISGDGLLCDAEVGIGHVCRDRFVVHGDPRDLALAIVGDVQQAEGAVAAQSEEVGNLLTFY